MDTPHNIDFKGLWAKRTGSQPDMEELLLKLRKLKHASLRKLIVTNVLLIGTSIYILYTWYNARPQLISTKAGIVLIILAMLVYLIAYNRLFSSYKTIDKDQSNAQYLQNLISIRSRQQFLQSTMLNLYFIMLSAGICLYMYEYTLPMTVGWAVLTYAIALAWAAFNWFYTRPRHIRKQQARVNDLINKFEAINRQLTEGQ